MSKKNSEKRRHKRYVVDGIQGNVLYLSNLDILNISIEGAAIETTKRLDVNREYTFKITYKDTILNLRGRVVWALLSYREKKDSEEIIPVYRAGVMFTDTLIEKTNTLLNFIEDNKIKALEKRVGGVRFKIANSRTVKINYPHKYEVKKISLSGMLIETEYPLDLNSHYDIELYLNKNILNVVGRIAHCEKIDSHNVTKYSIGIEFIKVRDNDIKILKDFLTSL
jgi:hypothetical protein